MFDSDTPGGTLAAQVEGARAQTLTDDALNEFVRATDALASWVAARQAEALAEMTRRAMVEQDHDRASDVVAAFRPEPVRLVAEQVAVELGISKTAASYRVAFAASLANYPVTAAAMQRGRLDRAKANVIVELLGSLHSDEFSAAVEAAAIEYAEHHTCPQLKHWLRKRIIAAEPAVAEQRRTDAKRSRRIRFFAGDDGMATLHAELSAEDALAIYRTIDQVAHASCAEAVVHDAAPVPEVTPDGRTMDQRRADAFTDILLGRRAAIAEGREPTSAVREVHVVVDAEVLAGVSERPGELVGYGAITAAHARELAEGDARWRRLLTDPAGHAVDVSPTTYRPGRELSRLVHARDVACRFPGCRRVQRHSSPIDLDHTVPFPEGATVPTNLAVLCRSHHLLKTHSDWHVEQEGDGVLCWTAPSGRKFSTYPHDYRSGAPPSADGP